MRLLILLLRFGAVLTMAAFPAMLLPVAWMDGVHQWLGMGPLPRAPVVAYLTRSIAALYGFHGVLLWIVSTDPVRYRPIVSYLAVMNVLFGLMLIAIDLHAGLPALWTALEGPPVVGVGIAIGVLNRSVPVAATEVVRT